MTRRRTAAALLVALTTIASAMLAPTRATADPFTTTAVVLRVVDGDTVDIRDDVRGRLRVRALGIDTPETKRPGYTVGCWGPEATQFAQDSLLGQRVALILDPTQDRTDRYGRTLAYLVKGDGWNYSVEAARMGAAHAYIYDNRPVQKFAEIAGAQQEAKDAVRGLWGPPCFGDTASTPIEEQAGAPAQQSPADDESGIGDYRPPVASPGRYYDSCAAARAAGVTPLLIGQPGYRSDLDGDGDGVACE